MTPDLANWVRSGGRDHTKVLRDGVSITVEHTRKTAVDRSRMAPLTKARSR